MSLSHNTRRELPDGLFPTEPLFLAAPGATAEDDGLVLMSGPDGGNQVELSSNPSRSFTVPARLIRPSPGTVNFAKVG